MRENPQVNREERIAKARRMAAEHAPQPQAKAQQATSRLAQRLSNVGASQARRHVAALEQSDKAVYVDPVKTPREWEHAVTLARMVTIARAKRRDTITHSEIKWAIHDELRMLVDDADFFDLAIAVNQDSDGVALASIIVHSDNGQPDDDVLLDAMERGFDLPLEALQRQVYEHFR